MSSLSYHWSCLMKEWAMWAPQTDFQNSTRMPRYEFNTDFLYLFLNLTSISDRTLISKRF